MQELKIRKLINSHIIGEKSMLVEVRFQNQITLPSKIAKTLGIKEGDLLDLAIQDGGVFLDPVVVYPKTELERVAKLVKQNADSPQVVFDSVEDLFRNIGINLEIEN